MGSRKTLLKVGTDCSGIEAPIQALLKLENVYQFRVCHMFSSEIDPYAKETLLKNYKPKVFYDDMRVSRILSRLDIYVCGFPCQPFSLCGHQLGSKDSRATIFEYCLDAIKQTNPKIFILENVRTIISIQGGTYYKKIQKLLKAFTDYEVHYLVLNTRDYNIAQNRERLFIVGLLKSAVKKPFRVPPKRSLTKSPKDYIDHSDTRKDSVPDFAKEL